MTKVILDKHARIYKKCEIRISVKADPLQVESIQYLCLSVSICGSIFLVATPLATSVAKWPPTSAAKWPLSPLRGDVVAPLRDDVAERKRSDAAGIARVSKNNDC